jgi:hypothetical protein
LEISEFFAVVLRGVVFQVTDRISPLAVRIAAEHGAPVAGEGDLRLQSSRARLVCITRDSGLVSFIPDGKTRDAETIDERAKIWDTQPVVAIFLNREMALQCATESWLATWDDRWLPASRATLIAIGDANRCFTRAQSLLPMIYD